jgi:hypothetical protein
MMLDYYKTPRSAIFLYDKKIAYDDLDFSRREPIMTVNVLDFLKRLDRKVTIRISPYKPEEPYQEVGFTM